MRQLIALALVAAAPALNAQVSCVTVGSFTSCSDATSYNRIGNNVFGSDGSSASRIGSSTFINRPTAPMNPYLNQIQPLQPIQPIQPQVPYMPAPMRCGWVGGRYVCG